MLIELQNVFDAAKANNLAFLIEFHTNMLNLVGSMGQSTFLHTAAESNAESVLSYLLDNGVDVDPRDSRGNTPLMIAYMRNNFSIMRKLISAGADVNLHQRTGLTMLQSSILNNNNTDMLYFLLENGADINQLSLTKKNPLINYIFKTNQFTRQKRREIAVELYENHGMELHGDMITPDGVRIFNLVISKACPKLAKIMLEKYPDQINLIDEKSKKTSLCEVIRRNRVDIVELLLECENIELNMEDKINNPVLIASLYGRSDILKMLFEKGARVVDGLVPGNFLLFIAKNYSVSNDQSKLNEVLEILSQNYDSSTIEDTPETCCYSLIHLASYHGWTLIVKKIIESSRANLDHAVPNECEKCMKLRPDSNFYGTPLRLASQSGHKEIVELLLDEKKTVSDNVLVPVPKFPEIVSLFMERELFKLEDVAMDIYDYPQSLQKLVCLHFKLNRNEEDFITFDDVEEIDNDHFILMENNIAWDISTLIDYIINITKGINEYDEKTPYKGEKIWTENDLKRIKNNYSIFDESGNLVSEKLLNFLNLNGVIQNVDQNFNQLLKTVGSVLTTRGTRFEETVKDVFTDEEMRIWRGQGRINMAMGQKIEKLKQEKLFELYEKYKEMSGEQKASVQKLYGSGDNFEDRINVIIRGEDCIMGFGSTLLRMSEKYDTYVKKYENEQSNPDEKEESVKESSDDLRDEISEIDGLDDID